MMNLPRVAASRMGGGYYWIFLSWERFPKGELTGRWLRGKKWKFKILQAEPLQSKVDGWPLMRKDALFFWDMETKINLRILWSAQYRKNTDTWPPVKKDALFSDFGVIDSNVTRRSKVCTMGTKTTMQRIQGSVVNVHNEKGCTCPEMIVWGGQATVWRHRMKPY